MLRIALALVCTLGFVLADALPCRANGILLEGDGSSGAARADHPVRLRQHTVRAKITGQIAEVTVEQIFHSRARRQLEGTYLFPLPEGAVVSDFAMTMGDTMVKGEVVEAKRARAIYEGIVRRRKDPGLLEYVGRGMYRARVFPILPGKDLTIRLSFQQVLKDDDGTLEFRYPLASDRMNGQSPSSAMVTVDIESPVDLKAIYSPSHRVEISRDGELKARASLESTSRRQSEDFVLYVGRSPEAVGFSMLSHKEAAREGTFMLVVAPQNQVGSEEQAPRDVIFVLDTSGSMQGRKIEQARRALMHGVNILGPRDRFNIISFSSSTRRFADGPVAINAATREGARLWIDRIGAKGGTDIHRALTEAVGMASKERSTMVVFLTDGLPSVGVQDPEAIRMGVARANRAKARIFTFGVGHDLDVKLLDTIAGQTGGARDYVAPQENIEIVTSRFFRKVSQPVLTGVKLELGDGVMDVYPRELGDLFAGTQVVVFGRYRNAGARTIALTGRLGERPVRIEHKALFRASAGPGYLERLWANRKVAFLLDAIRLNGESKEVREEVVALATQHHIVTPYTSGLVIEDDVMTDNDLPFEESFGQAGGGRGGGAPFEGPASNGTIGIGGGAGGAFRGRGGSRDMGTGGGGRKKSDDAVDDALRWLASHQSPDGRWSAYAFDRWCDGKPSAPWEETPLRGDAARDVHVTAQALSAFLAAGYTNRGKHPFARSVSKGLRWLKTTQDPEGCFGARNHVDYVDAHAHAALAMVEAYGMTGSPIWRDSAQRGLDFLALARNPYGVWGRGVKPGESDLRTTVWAATAFMSASLINWDAVKRGKRAPLTIHRAALDGITAWIAKVEDPDRGGVRASVLGQITDWPKSADEGHKHRTAAAMLGWLRALAGEDPRKSKGLKLCAQRVQTAPKGSTPWVEEHHFGTLLLFLVGGKPWSTWRKQMEAAGGAYDLQVRTGSYCGAKGSWTPVGPRSAQNGRVYATAMRAMDFAVFYRYANVRNMRIHRAATTQHPRARGGAKPKPLSATEASKDLKARKTAASGSEIRTTGRSQRVGGKTFDLDVHGRWLDTAWDRKAKPTRVESMSETWFTLSRRSADIANMLALGDALVIVLDGTVYEVVPAK